MACEGWWQAAVRGRWWPSGMGGERSKWVGTSMIGGEEKHATYDYYYLLLTTYC